MQAVPVTALNQAAAPQGTAAPQGNNEQPRGPRQGRKGAAPAVASERRRSVPSIDLAAVSVAPAVLELIPAATARRYRLLPVRRDGRRLTVAMAEPSNVFAQDDITFMTGCIVEPVAAPAPAIAAAISRCYPAGSDATAQAGRDTADRTALAGRPATTGGSLSPSASALDELASLARGAADSVAVRAATNPDLARSEHDAPIIRLVDGILARAHQMNASDVHIEPFEQLLRVRFRVDGICETVLRLPPALRSPVVSRIKVMAKLDIAERRLPQDGRCRLQLHGSAVLDLRVSVLPGLFGEKVVLRLLDRSALHRNMTTLGFEEAELARFRAAIHRPNGMVLVTGPTGSGKTTTLYSALAELNREEVNIVTVEDPVEYNLAGITQVEVRERIGLGFASSLRSFLRQDPDIMLIGEIRDHETARIAIKAALTGHLVLSTLHTNDAATAISRLIDLGLEPFLVAYSLQLVVAQRLVRRVCAQCREEVTAPTRLLVEMGLGSPAVDDLRCWQGRGCDSCRGTGYQGRLALFEVLPVSDEIRQLILAGDTGLGITQAARDNGAAALRASGLRRVCQGLTTIEEVLRVTC